MSPTDNPYLILGVSQQATIYEIKRAYRRLALTYHPDKNPGNPQAEEKFRQVRQAYDILLDPVQRRQADDRLHIHRPYKNPGFGPYAFNKHGPPAAPPKEEEIVKLVNRDTIFRYIIKPAIIIAIAAITVFAIKVLSR